MTISIGPLQCGSGVGACRGEYFGVNEGNVTKAAGLRFTKLPQRAVGRMFCQVRASCCSDESERRDCRREAKCGRRELGTESLAFLLGSLSIQSDALAGLDKYLKRKKLDPLDTYVPTVLLAQSQFQEVGGKAHLKNVIMIESNYNICTPSYGKLGGEQKTYADARSLLRTGPAASLRTDIRAVAQYASETGNDDGTSAVDQCLSALEDLDSLLLQASRSQGAPVERMRKDLTTTVTALDRLLATVPAPILEKAKAIAEAYKDSSY